LHFFLNFGIFIRNAKKVVRPLKRQKDQTPHKCKLCKEVLPASGMPSHLYHKHNKLSSDQYVQKFGEFRRKYKEAIKKQKKVSVSCKECGKGVHSHKALIHHINKVHSGWQSYIIKHIFKGEHPTCKCGCGEKVKLLRSGKDDKGNLTYARSYINGHDTKTRRPGYRSNTKKQKQKMSTSAINRRKREGTYYIKGPSKSEKKLADFIEGLGFQIIRSDRETLLNRELDIYIPSRNIAIEYNGSRFHSQEFKKDKRAHLKKTEACAELGIRLLHIWEPDYYHNPEIVQGILKHVLGKTERVLYGRQTIVREIDNKTAVEFLQKNHLQGSSISKVRLGLFFNNELVSVMTFSSLRRATGRVSKEGSYELIRYSSLLGTQVVGGASKLFKQFIKEYNPNYVLSYANRDWSYGNLYHKLGMELKGYTPPGYFYVKSRYRYSRFEFQKHKLVEQGKDPNKTEYEIMLEDGYARIWDCGNIIFEYNKA
jgi:hypothetical protein